MISDMPMVAAWASLPGKTVDWLLVDGLVFVYASVKQACTGSLRQCARYSLHPARLSPNSAKSSNVSLNASFSVSLTNRAVYVFLGLV